MNKSAEYKAYENDETGELDEPDWLDELDYDLVRDKPASDDMEFELIGRLMVVSLAYGLTGSAFLIMLTNLSIKVFKKFNNVGYSIVYASLFLKLVFVSGFILATKNEIPNQIMFAVAILGGIMYSTVNVILKLK